MDKTLVIYDTSNYVDFPIGGQLTSVRNFLTYLTEYQRDFCKNVILIGITNKTDEVGKKSKVVLNGYSFNFLPVVYRDTDLENVKNSLRIEFLKGLFKYRKLIPHGKDVLHYIHTPEAFIQIKICHPFSKTAIFSHGNLFNTVKTFRFFENNKFVKSSFDHFIKWMLKRANLIFVLDDDSVARYSQFNKRVIKVNNSIVLPEKDYTNKEIHDPVRMLFVGRLSKIKRVDEIIRAAETENFDATLTIVGDGEERNYLESIVTTDKISFRGALKPDQVKEELANSDILVMNSVLEGKPMTIIEAMSYGLPIITTNVGGISELVEFGTNGEDTNGSIVSIVDAACSICKNYKSFSKASFIIAKKFDYKVVNNIIFEKLLSF